MKYVSKSEYIDVIEVGDNYEKLKKFAPEIEKHTYLSNKHYNTKEEDGEYYVIVQKGAFNFVLGYIHITKGQFLCKTKSGKYFNLSKKELNSRYENISKRNRVDKTV